MTVSGGPHGDSENRVGSVKPSTNKLTSIGVEGSTLGYFYFKATLT